MTRLRGLYAITPELPRTTLPLVKQVEHAIAGGARMIQYRDKGRDREQRLRDARALAAVCHANTIPLIVNDDLDLAEQSGADGVHLGKGDADPGEARKRLGPGAIVGVSCYDQLVLGRGAEEIGADYAAFGRFYPSTTKPHAVRATLDLLHLARERLSIPIVAIGGITPENGRPLIAAGADMLAVVDAVFGRRDIRAAAAAFDAIFHEGDPDS